MHVRVRPPPASAHASAIFALPRQCEGYAPGPLYTVLHAMNCSTGEPIQRMIKKKKKAKIAKEKTSKKLLMPPFTNGLVSFFISKRK
jgi:hypothetical protein